MIPSLAHFIWYGPSLPWLHEMAIVSAARNGGFERLVLHHGVELNIDVQRHLQSIPRLELRLIDPARTFKQLDDRDALAALYTRLSQPAARANLLRAALLMIEGGVYLDMDTVTLGDFQALRAADAFCGSERIALPSTTVQAPTPLRTLRAYSLMLLRDLLRRLPDGPRWFRKVEHLYALAANNAVLGASPRHPFIRALLNAMCSMPAVEQMRRYALGTHLLQNTLVRLKDSEIKSAST